MAYGGEEAKRIRLGTLWLESLARNMKSYLSVMAAISNENLQSLQIM